MGVIALLLLACLAWSGFQLQRLQAEVRYAKEIVGRFERDRAAARSGTTTQAADALWRLYLPSLDSEGQPRPFHGSVALLVEQQRQAAIQDAMGCLRAKTSANLGDDPEAWIRHYGDVQTKEALAAMTETNRSLPTVSRHEARD
jgi:hypothetical protein